jgi:phage head maturation protease
VTDTKQVKFAQVKTAESDNPNGEFEAVLSMATLDRDGEVIDAKAFDPLPDHITIDIDHGRTAATTVGSGQPFYDGDTLKIRGSFASTQLAQDIRSLVTEGHIRSMSVAFMDAKKQAKDGNQHITKRNCSTRLSSRSPRTVKRLCSPPRASKTLRRRPARVTTRPTPGSSKRCMTCRFLSALSAQRKPRRCDHRSDAADPEPGEDPNTSFKRLTRRSTKPSTSSTLSLTLCLRKRSKPSRY